MAAEVPGRPVHMQHSSAGPSLAEAAVTVGVGGPPCERDPASSSAAERRSTSHNSSLASLPHPTTTVKLLRLNEINAASSAAASLQLSTRYLLFDMALFPATFTAEAAARVSANPEQTFSTEQALWELERRRLLQVSVQTRSDGTTQHRFLVCDAAKMVLAQATNRQVDCSAASRLQNGAAMGPEDDAVEVWCKGMTDIVGRMAKVRQSMIEYQTTTLDEINRLAKTGTKAAANHVFSTWDAEKTNMLHAMEISSEEERARICAAGSFILRYVLNPRVMVQLFESLMIARDPMSPIDNDIDASLAFSVARGFVSVERLDEAKELFHNLEEFLICTNQTETYDYARVHQNLARIHELRGDLIHAEEMLSDSLELRRQLPGGIYDTGFLFHLGDLGRVYLKQNKTDLAKSVFHSQLVMLDRVGLGCTREAGATMTQLAYIARGSGDYEESYDLCCDAIRAFKDCFVAAGMEPGRPLEGETFTGLGLSCEGVGRLDAASDAYSQALCIFRNLQVEPHASIVEEARSGLLRCQAKVTAEQSTTTAYSQCRR